jgi:hypothetical protein
MNSKSYIHKFDKVILYDAEKTDIDFKYQIGKRLFPNNNNTKFIYILMGGNKNDLKIIKQIIDDHNSNNLILIVPVTTNNKLLIHNYFKDVLYYRIQMVVQIC